MDFLNSEGAGLMEYIPAGKLVGVEKPPSVAVTVRDAPVFSSVMVTSALGTAAPGGSRTVPVMFPVVLDWACTPTSRPILSRSKDACTQDLIDIQHLLGIPEVKSRVP